MTTPIPKFIRDRLRSHITHSLLPRLLRYVDQDLLDLAYRQIGVGNYESAELTGEKWLLEQALPRLLTRENRVMLDVGANTGEYSQALCLSFPNARIYALEPMPGAFAQLERRVGHRVQCHQLGLSDVPAQNVSIYDYADGNGSAHASLFKDVLVDLHKSKGLSKFEIELTTLDNFCSANSISAIDFLKVDTEGCEMQVLRGAKQMLDLGAIRLIQFEFNEMNVIARVFLRDFYEVLRDFDLFRLLPNRLLRLGAYWSRYEVFAYQNLLAVRQGEFDETLIHSLTVVPK
jgi:FkbM family methyltransferase